MNLLLPHGFEVNYVMGFARGLAANGVAFTVISDDAIAGALEAAGFSHSNLRGSVDPTRPSWQKAMNLVRYYILLLWTVFLRRGDTVHFCGVLASRMILFEGIVLPVWFRLWAGRYIHTAHNALPHSRESSRLFRCLYRWIYRFPDKIIAHTGKVSRQLESDFGVESSRVKVISIGLNEEVPDTHLSSAEARSKLGLPAAAPVALLFGKVEPYKGAEVLIEAWGLLRRNDARLVIVGVCADAGYARVVREAIGRSPRAESIEWREGFVPNTAIAQWFKACNVVVMPYRNIYQSGIVFLCLRFGVPIVASNVGSLAEYVNEDCGIIAEANDSRGIASALDRFFSDPVRFDRETIVEHAAKYRWEIQCALIKPLYD